MVKRAPSGLGAAGRASWHRAYATLTELGEDPALSADAMERYARAVDEAATLRAEWKKLGSPGTRLNRLGGVMPEPLLIAIDRAERRAKETAADLGLDPAARKHLARAVGRPPGAASAPDRAASKRRELRIAQ